MEKIESIKTQPLPGAYRLYVKSTPSLTVYGMPTLERVGNASNSEANSEGTLCHKVCRYSLDGRPFYIAQAMLLPPAV